jgi:hypothetical protein
MLYQRSRHNYNCYRDHYLSYFHMINKDNWINMFFFRWGVDMPDVVNQSITILSSGGLGMATFSLGKRIDLISIRHRHK